MEDVEEEDKKEDEERESAIWKLENKRYTSHF